jgi:hypothetical protein
MGSPESVTDFRDQIRDPADAIQALIRSHLLDVHVALPAQVTEAFDPARCSVTVKPLLRRPIPAADGTFPAEDLPEIYDVPVCFPMFGGFQITMPISVGDVCMLIFPDYDPGAWRANGAETHPGDIRRHHLSGACALFGGMRTLGNPLASYNASALEFGRSSGLRVSVTASQMRVGGNTKQVALADAVRADLLSIKTDLTNIATAAGTSSAYVVSSENALGSDVLKVGS